MSCGQQNGKKNREKPRKTNHKSKSDLVIELMVAKLWGATDSEFEFTLGSNTVVQGWNVGIMGAKKGSRRPWLPTIDSPKQCINFSKFFQLEPKKM